MSDFHNSKDLRVLQNILKGAGITTYLIDDQLYPEAFKHSTMRFIADCSLKDLYYILQKNFITYDPSLEHRKEGYVQVEGPKHKSIVYVDTLCSIEPETVGEELIIALQDGWAVQWFWSMKDNGSLKLFFPELHDTVVLEGGAYHGETVFEHLMCALKAASAYSTKLKLAVLLHDIGKPAAYKTSKDEHGKVAVSFHSHEILGATIAYNLCQRLKFHPETTRYVTKMVRLHMFHFTSESSDKSIRAWLYKLGKHDWQDIFRLRIADRQGNKKNEEKPVFTQEFKALQKRVKNITNDGTIIFKEDLDIKYKDLKNIIRDDANLEEIYKNLIGIVNQDKTRNNKEWLKEHVKRVYG